MIIIRRWLKRIKKKRDQNSDEDNFHEQNNKKGNEYKTNFSKINRRDAIINANLSQAELLNIALYDPKIEIKKDATKLLVDTHFLKELLKLSKDPVVIKIAENSIKNYESKIIEPKEEKVDSKEEEKVDSKEEEKVGPKEELLNLLQTPVQEKGRYAISFGERLFLNEDEVLEIFNELIEEYRFSSGAYLTPNGIFYIDEFNTIKVWENHNNVESMGYARDIFTISANSKIIAYYYKRNIEFWHLSEREMKKPTLTKLEYKLKISKDKYYSLDAITFSPNNKYICTASSYEKTKIWDIKTGKIYHEFDEGSSAVQFSFDNKYLALIKNLKLTLFDVEKRRVMFHHKIVSSKSEIRNQKVRFSPNGKFLAISYKEIIRTNYDDELEDYDSSITAPDQLIIMEISTKYKFSFSSSYKYFILGNNKIYLNEMYGIIGTVIEEEFLNRKLDDLKYSFPSYTYDDEKNQKRGEKYIKKIIKYIETYVIKHKSKFLFHMYYDGFWDGYQDSFITISFFLDKLGIKDEDLEELETIFLFLRDLGNIKVSTIDLSNNLLTEVPNISLLNSRLDYINLSNNQIKHVKYRLHAHEIILADNQIKEYPDDLLFTNYIDLSNNNIMNIDTISINNTNNSKIGIDLSNNKLQYFEVNFSTTTKRKFNIEYIDLHNNVLVSMPLIQSKTEIVIEYLDLSNNQIDDEGLEYIEYPPIYNLDLKHNKIVNLDFAKMRVPDLISLSVQFNKIERIINIDSYYFTALAHIFLEGNYISYISEIYDLRFLHNIKEISFGDGTKGKNAYKGTAQNKRKIQEFFDKRMEEELISQLVHDFTLENKIVYLNKFPLSDINDTIFEIWDEVKGNYPKKTSKRKILKVIKDMIKRGEIIGYIDVLNEILVIKYQEDLR